MVVGKSRKTVREGGGKCLAQREGENWKRPDGWRAGRRRAGYWAVG
jgi:hypothetical protein